MKRRITIALLTLVISIFCAIGMVACTVREKDNPSHTHTYSSTWSYDENYHWHKATCEHTSEINGRAAHIFNGDVCSVCGYVKGSAIEQPTQFSIVFDANGGLFESAEDTYTITLNSGALLSSIEEPQRDGYKFNGWYTSTSLKDLWDFDKDTVTKSLTLYAGWTEILEDFDVTFILNYSGASQVVSSTENGLVTFVPTRAGYVFNGWWLSDGKTDEGYILSKKYDTTKPVTAEGLVLYAEWVEESTIASQLVAPSVSISQREFSWGAVVGATGYNVRVYRSGSNEELVNETVTGTIWNFPSGYEAGYYTVKIRANGDGVSTVNSSYVSKSFAYNILSAISSIEFDLSTSVLTWTAVANATEYELYINNQIVQTAATTSYDMSDLEAGNYSVKIIATREGYQSSVTSKTVEKKRLRTPVNIRSFVNGQNNGYTLTWNTVSRADTYIITIGDKEVRVAETTYSIGADSTFWNGSQVLMFTIQAFDSNADYLISNASEEITLGKIYSLEVNANIENIGEILIEGEIYVPQEYTVSFNLDGGVGSIADQKITAENGVIYPAIPTKNGYAFRGWYTDSDCKTLYNFSSPINKDMTLYAGWQAMATSYYSRNYIDITSGYNNSSNAYSLSTSGTSSSNYKYTYFTALTSGTYYIYYKNGSSGSNYGTYTYIYNATKGTTIKSNSSVTSTSYTSASFTAEAGDIIYVRNYRYNTSYYATFYFYVTGGVKPTAGGKVSGGDYMQAEESRLSKVLVSYGEEVTVKATTTDDRYIFAGWYNGETCLSKESTYSFTMPSANTVYTARWSYYSVTSEKSIANAGTITEHTDTPIKVGEKVTLTATTNNGYTWLGWYNGDTCLTDDLAYTFTMNAESVTYTAKWIECPVVLDKVVKTDKSDEAGTVSGVGGATKVGEQVTIIATTNNGYTWLGWYDAEGNNVSNGEMTYSFVMPADTIVYTAKWTYYTVTTTTNESSGGSYTNKNAEKVTVGDRVALSATTNSGYMWMGWYKNTDTEPCSHELNYSFTMAEEDVTYTAKWMVCPVTVVKNIEEAGTISGLSNTTVLGDEITLTATTNEGYTWLGWFCGDETEPLTTSTQYTFNLVTSNVTYVAKWTYYTLTTEADDSLAGSVITYTNKKITVGQSVTVTASTNTGYTFDGWYNGTEFISNNATYSFNMPAQNLIYTAKWVTYTLTVNTVGDGGSLGGPGQFMVSFDLNGATGTAPAQQRITETNGLSYPTIPTRNGYVFAGWYSNATCTGSPFDFSASVDKDITLYAKWIAYTGNGVLTLNGNLSISVVSKTSSTKSYYAFVPLVNGSISVYSAGGLSDTYGYLYDSSKTQITYDDDSGDGNNFKITYNVTAGTLYYVGPYGYNSNGTTTIYLSGDLPNAGGKSSDQASIDSGAVIKITAGEDYTISAKTEDGYTFLGWFRNDETTAFSTDLSCVFTMPKENITISAKWIICPITLAKEPEEAGTVSGLEGATRVGEQTTIIAHTNEGYTFDGWYIGTNKVSSDERYTFTLTVESVTYTAKWIYYTLTTDTNMSNAGTFTAKTNEKVSVGESITLTATVNEGYTWLGWYNGNECLSEELSYTFEMPASNITYTAKYVAYTISTESSDNLAGTYTIKTNEKVTAGSSVTLTATVNEGYTWLGWYEGNDLLSEDLTYTFDMPSRNITYTAKYDAYTLTVEKTEGGNTGMLSARIYFDLNGASGTAPSVQTVTKTVGLTYPNVPTRSGYLFTGWYTEEACTNLFDFSSNVTSDMTLYAGWYSYSGKSIEVGAYTSSSPYAVSMSGTSSTEPEYVYFRALRTGSYTFGYKNSSSSSSYATYLYIYDVTSGTNLTANTSITTTSFSTLSLTLTTGHIYYARLYRYSSSYTPTFSMYLSGTLKPTAGGKTTGNTDVNNYKICADESVTLVATTNAGYTFLGWYNGTERVADTLSYTFTMPKENITYIAKWAPCTVTITKNIDDAGSISGLPSTTIAGQNITLTAKTNAGYTFLGWFRNDETEPCNTELKYTFAVPESSTTYTAKWASCTVTLVKNIEEAGSISSLPSTTVVGNDVTVTATTNNGYTFMGWYIGEQLVTNELSLTFAMPKNTVLYTAKWMTCPITLNKNITEAGSVSGVYGATRIGEETTIVAENNSGYTFVGWRKNNETEYCSTNASYTFVMSETATTYTACWTYYTLTINTTEGGAIGKSVAFNLNGGKGDTPSTQIITRSNGLVYPDIPVRSGYVFTGWYTESGCVNLYDFTKEVTKNVTLYAGWYAIEGNSTIEINQYTQSNSLTFSTYGSSESLPKYTYFRALNTGTYTLGYKNGTSSSTSYATYLYIYDITESKVIRNNNYVYNTSWSTLSLSLTQGHVYYIRTYRYNTSYSTNFAMYLSGTLKPSVGGLSDSVISNQATKITAGEEITISAVTQDGYIWQGWYDGNTKLTDDLQYTFEMPNRNVTYTAKWSSYTLSIDKTDGGNVEIAHGPIEVSFDLNGGNGTVAKQYITQDIGLKYPNIIPTRSGHVFTGWYYDADATALYDFTSSLDKDLILYAGWYKLSGNVIEINEYSSSNPYSISTQGSYYISSNKTIEAPILTYFRILSTGTYSISYKNSSSSPSARMSIFDVTADRTIKARVAITSTAFVTETYSLEAGHIYYISVLGSSTATHTTFSMYITGTLFPKDGGKASGIENTLLKLLPGQKVTVSAFTEKDYTFLGWFKNDENTPVSKELVYTFVMESENVTYTAKWAGYTVTVVAKVDNVVSTAGGSGEIVRSHTVSFNLNGGTGKVESQTITATNPLMYPEIPLRTGYAFRGWYTTASCETLYNFSAPISCDVTLYAGWQAMSTSYVYSKNYIDVSNNYNSESNCYSFSNANTSSSKYYYTYFTALTAGTYNLYYKNQSSGSYGTYIYVYNATKGETIQANTNCNVTTYSSISFTANAGDVIYVRNYRYSTSYTSNFFFYVTGGNRPTAGGKVDNISENVAVKYAAGESVTIVATTKYGYTWDGWYLNDDLVSTDLTYTFTMPNEYVVFEARWKCFTVTTTANAEGGTYTKLNAQKTANGEDVTLTATLDDGYTWIGWFDENGNNVSNGEMTYTFTMGAEHRTFEARYGFENVTLIYVIDGVEVDRQTMTFENNNAELLERNMNGNNFDGWYANSSCNSTLEKVTDTKKLSADSNNNVYLYGATYMGTSGLSFTKNSDGYSITGYDGEETDITLPELYNGVAVTSIANGVFTENNSIYKITLPSSIKQISANAFKGCYRLAEVVNLSELSLVKGSTDHGYVAYYATAIYSSTSNDGEFVNDNGYVFYYDGAKYYLVDYVGEDSELTLPETVNGVSYEIADRAFHKRDNITGVVMSSGVTKIGEYAFSECTALATIEIGQNVNSIAETSFYMCSALRSVTVASENTAYTCLDNNVIELTSHKLILGCSDNIPNDGSVTVIGAYAFAYRTNIQNITINSHITEVKEYAFYGCSGLNSITIQSGITAIGEKAFYGASFIRVVVPTSVNTIGYAAFGGNGSITSITLPFIGGSKTASTASEETLFGYIFGRESYANATRITQYYSATQSVSYYIPSGLTTVTITGGKALYGAFYGCSRISTLTVTVSQIAERAFYNCYGLTNLTISSASLVGTYAFANCYRLTSLTIPSSVTSIGSSALYGCYGLTSLTIPFVGNTVATTASQETLFGYIFGENSYTNSVAVLQKYNSNYSNNSVKYYLPAGLTTVTVTRGSLLYGAFYGCDKLTNVTLTSVSAIGDSAFYGCTGLTEFTVPYSVTSIGSSAFYGCTALGSITIGSNVATIGTSAFYNCSSLQTVTIPSKVTAISNSLFSGCSSLSQVTMQGSVTSIGSSAFLGCSALQTIAIPNSVTSIGDAAFKNSGLTSLALPSSLSSTGLGNNIIFGCDSLTTLTISGSSVYTSTNNCIIKNKVVVLGCKGSTIPTTSTTATSIGSYAFSGCGLTSLTIPSNIITIADHAFANSGLTSITIPSSVTSVGSYAFSECQSLTTATFNGSTTTIGTYAFNFCQKMTRITLPSSLAAINAYTFYYCTSLSSITIPNTVTSIGTYAFFCNYKLTSITVPNSVTTIGENTFGSCTALTSISLPFIGGSATATSASASTLFGYIFGSNYGSYSGWTEVNQSYASGKSVTYRIPTSLKTVTLTTDCNIFYGAFHNCTMLTTINLPSNSSITKLPAYAFCNTAITSITIPSGVTAFEEYALNGTNITSINIPTTVTSISNTALRNNSKLTSISIPNSVKSLGEGTLSGCSSLTSVTLPFVGASATQDSRTCGYPFGYIFGTSSYSGSTATSQTYYSVQYTSTSATTTYYIPTSLKSVTILNHTSGYWGSSDGATDKYLPCGAFYGCSNLTSITLPSTINYIFRNTFYGCSSLSGITIPSGVTIISDSAFYECTNLATVTFSGTSKLNRIGMYAFKKCSNLKSITLPTSLTIMEHDCFSESGLTSVTIPANVESTYSGNWFTNCKSLTTVKYSGSKVTFIGGYSGCSALTSITLPSSATEIGSEAFANCTSLASITIPSKVTKIGVRAFLGCSALTSVTFSSTSGWSADSTSVTVTNKATNATNLTTTYVYRSWTKS